MKYNDNGEYKDIYVKSFDTLPVGAIVEYSGATIPSGWTDIENNKIQKTSQYIEGGAGLPSYFTDEIKTGEFWIDGKPLYRKVIDLGSLPNNTYKEVSTGLINVNISLTKIYGVAYTSTRDSQVALGDIYTRFEVRSGNNVIRVTTTANYSAYTGYAILEYTKATD